MNNDCDSNHGPLAAGSRWALNAFVKGIKKTADFLAFSIDNQQEENHSPALHQE